MTTKCPKMLEILKHKSQKFGWDFAPDTLLDITVLSHTVLWFLVVYCSNLSSFKGLIFISIKKLSILQQSALKCFEFNQSQKFALGLLPRIQQNF